jgi:hypothetical protein
MQPSPTSQTSSTPPTSLASQTSPTMTQYQADLSSSLDFLYILDLYGWLHINTYINSSFVIRCYYFSITQYLLTRVIDAHLCGENKGIDLLPTVKKHKVAKMCVCMLASLPCMQITYEGGKKGVRMGLP